MEQSELGQKWLTQLLETLGYPSMVYIADEENNPRCGCSLVIDHANLRPHQIQALIGTDGVAIDAMQHLANACLNAHLNSVQPNPSGASESFFYVVELNGYRKERQAVLEKIAQEAIAYVTENQKDYEIKNLNAAERRQIHVFFEDYPHLETFSEGKEPHRHLVVRLVTAPEEPLENQLENQLDKTE
jgi:spoIIIJ-associated protein